MDFQLYHKVYKTLKSERNIMYKLALPTCEWNKPYVAVYSTYVYI